MILLLLLWKKNKWTEKKKYFQILGMNNRIYTRYHTGGIIYKYPMGGGGVAVVFKFTSVLKFFVSIFIFFGFILLGIVFMAYSQYG